MEGMPRVPMFAPDLKFCSATLPTNFATQIKEYILIHYQDDPVKYDAAIGEIEKMRSKLSRLLPDLETLNILKRYYAQLCLMKNRFPMEEGDTIRVAFSWMDKGMDMPNAAVFEDINYELACVMYNIGAVHGTIAANELRTDLNSIKNAFTHFQCAAYPFQQIRDSMNAVKYSAVDFDPSLLTFYINILLAQAQECLLEKGIMDHRKNTVIAKLAVHLRDVYMQCREHLEVSNLNDIVSSSRYKEWLRTCNVKSEIYGAIAMFHQGCQAEDENKMGFRLAYFDIALEHITTAMKLVEKDKRECLKETVIFLNDIIVGKQKNAKKENEFIYHDRLPKSEELTTVEGVAMVKAVGFDPTKSSVAGPDLFAALLPGNVLKSLSVYSEEKAKFKRAILERVEEKDKELEDYIKSLQLEEINIDDETKVKELPEMLLERSAAFNSQPDAFPELLDKLHRVGDCAIEADHKINDLHNRLDAINSPQLKNDEGFVAIMKELNRINDHHMKARTNNSELQRALAAHSENLKILAMPLNELSKRLTDNQTRPADSVEGKLLKKMLDKTNEMSAQRRVLLSKLSEELLNDDITAKCLAEKNEDNQALYEKELKKHEETAKLIDMNLTAQQNILSALTDANASFGDYRRKIIEENKSRMDQVLALTAAYDVYVDVSQKTEEGLKFYSTLFTLLRGLDEAVEAIENAFEEEKKEWEKEMLRELEKRTTGGAKWSRPANDVEKDRQIDLSLGFGNEGNESALEAGCKGLKLKDCMEYYRTNIATSRIRTAPLPSSQALSSPGASQLSGYQDSVTSQSHLTPFVSNQSIPNTPLNAASMGIQGPDMLPARTSPLPVPLSSQPSITAGAGPLPSNSSPSTFQNTAISQPQFPVNQYMPVHQNPVTKLYNPPSANAQQVVNFVTPPTPVIPDTSKPFPTASIPASVPGQSSAVPQNVAFSTKQSAPLNICPANVPYMSNSAVLRHPAIIHQPRTNLNTGKTVEMGKPVAGTVVQPQAYTPSPFSPIRMPSDFAGNMPPASTITAFTKPSIIPTHNFMFPQGATPHAVRSPWHQPLGSAINMNGQAAVATTEINYTRDQLPTSPATPQTFIPSNIAAPTRSTPAVDIMNAPLEAVLPAPLAPTHLQTSERESSSSSVQLITIHSVPSSESIKTEEIHLTQTPKSSENMTGTTLCSNVVQTPRPAAAVAPIMQADCGATLTNDSMLSITKVTSMSAAAPLHQFNSTVPCPSSQSKMESNEGNKEERSSSVREVMNPQTFTIGETDPVRLEKRHMREQFRAEGVAAQLPPLDPADPINCIDAHYWLNKP